MSKMVRCNNCGVAYKKQGINLFILVILFMLGIVPAVIYLLVKKNKCPLCGFEN